MNAFCAPHLQLNFVRHRPAAVELPGKVPGGMACRPSTPQRRLNCSPSVFLHHVGKNGRNHEDRDQLDSENRPRDLVTRRRAGL